VPRIPAHSLILRRDMKKYRAKIETPWCKKDEVFWDDSFSSCDPSLFPEVFEEIKDEPEFKIMSPAVIHNGAVTLSYSLFENETQAKESMNQFFISWPATQVIDGKDVAIQIKAPVRKV
jgi:hypothetical protein